MPVEVNIGSFDEIVELFSCFTTKDARGAKVESYTFAGMRLANVDLTSSETDADYNVVSERSITVTMHKVFSIDTRWRLRWRGHFYNIQSVRPVDRMSPFTIVTAEEVM